LRKLSKILEIRSLAKNFQATSHYEASLTNCIFEYAFRHQQTLTLVHLLLKTISSESFKALGTSVATCTTFDGCQKLCLNEAKEWIFMNEAGPTSNHPHWPGGASGVTLGAGFDMKKRSALSIYEKLISVGTDPDLAAIFSKGAKKSGTDAKEFLASEYLYRGEIWKVRSLSITKEQEKALYEITYPEYFNEVKRIITSNESVKKKYGAPDFSKINCRILGVLVDMIYRGDWHPDSRSHMFDGKMLQQYVTENDKIGFAGALSSWGNRVVGKTTENKKGIDNRFNTRINWLLRDDCH